MNHYTFEELKEGLTESFETAHALDAGLRRFKRSFL